MYVTLPIICVIWALGIAGMICAVVGLRLALRKRWWAVLLWFALAAVLLALPVITQIQGMAYGRARSVRRDVKSYEEPFDVDHFDEESP